MLSPNSATVDAAARALTHLVRRAQQQPDTSTLVFLTGAGASTASNIPDYRGPNGTYTRLPGYRPITFQHFVASHTARVRYWSRSFFGYPRMRAAVPNAAHRVLAEWTMTRRWLQFGVTQNVDGLHRDIPSLMDDPLRGRLVEMHGRLAHIRCVQPSLMGTADICGTVWSRDWMQGQLEQLNPEWFDAWQAVIRSRRSIDSTPDGDVDVASLLLHADTSKYAPLPEFRYPLRCPTCRTGLLKPDVVFFGENMQAETRVHLKRILDACTGLVVLGTSLAVPSARRVVEHVLQQGQPVLVLTLGGTALQQASTRTVHDVWRHARLLQEFDVDCVAALQQAHTHLSANASP